MEILYYDRDILVCIKPAGVLSTDEPGGLPELLRNETGLTNIRTVHRLDRVVCGVMLLALNKKAASRLSEQIRGNIFSKKYLAAVHGITPDKGRFSDLLERNKQERKTYVTDTPSKEAQLAELEFETVDRAGDTSLVSIRLITGRTHQIRCQFSAHSHSLIGDKKYGTSDDDCDIALWSHSLSFEHPYTGEAISFSELPPRKYPWSEYSFLKRV